jgi:hypothetical protein
MKTLRRGRTKKISTHIVICMCILGFVYNFIAYVFRDFPLPYREVTNYCRIGVTQEQFFILQVGSVISILSTVLGFLYRSYDLS